VSYKPFDLTGKVALVTGGNRGIGLGMAEAMAQAGADIVIWGTNAERFDMTFTKDTGWIATLLAKNKMKTSRTLAGGYLPVPACWVAANADEAEKAADDLGWPVVVKPSNQDQGLGVVAGIRDVETLRRAFDEAAKLSPAAVIVEKHIDGDDHRLLVVRGRMITAVRRTAAGVMGDGVRTVAQLVELVLTSAAPGDPVVLLAEPAMALPVIEEFILDLE
jgi:NAD(P)-dependent dehydrogenase (short-subunit alcohol dehydrogenase family)